MKSQATGREEIFAIHISDKKKHDPDSIKNFYKSITKDNLIF